MAEDAAREPPNLPLENALQLVHLYAERGSPKYERAAMRWLERYITEDEPRLRHFAEIATPSRTAGSGVDARRIFRSQSAHSALLGGLSRWLSGNSLRPFTA